MGVGRPREGVERRSREDADAAGGGQGDPIRRKRQRWDGDIKVRSNS